MRGASKGEGLGNQFLANIRECDAVAHVVRCFVDNDVTHVENRLAPIDDIEIIETELMLADLDSLEKRVLAMEKKAKGGDKEAKETLDLVNRCLALLRDGKPARLVAVKPEEKKLFAGLGLLSSKPVLYVCNVEEESADAGNALSAAVAERAAAEGAESVVVSAKIESEIAVLPAAEQKDYLDAIGLAEPGLNRAIRAGYALLHLVTYFTVGPKETRAWTITQGTRAPGRRGRDPFGLREGLHPRRNHRLRRLRRQQGRGRRPRRRQVPARGQGLRRGGRRRAALPLQHLSGAGAPGGAGPLSAAAAALRPAPWRPRRRR